MFTYPVNPGCVRKRTLQEEEGPPKKLSKLSFSSLMNAGSDEENGPPKTRVFSQAFGDETFVARKKVRQTSPLTQVSEPGDSKLEDMEREDPQTASHCWETSNSYHSHFQNPPCSLPLKNPEDFAPKLRESVLLKNFASSASQQYADLSIESPLYQYSQMRSDRLSRQILKTIEEETANDPIELARKYQSRFVPE